MDIMWNVGKVRVKKQITTSADALLFRARLRREIVNSIINSLYTLNMFTTSLN